MDVTSLLNSGAASTVAAEQQKKVEGTRSTPTRSRTPWNAGGYALPFNTISLAPQLIPPPPIQYDEARRLEYRTPNSPTHKSSGSRSSLSSFTSSLQSATHSRYSSMSTVNSIHPLNSLALESLSLNLGNAPQALEFATLDAQSDALLSTSQSPTGSLDALALVAEQHPFSPRPTRQSSDETLKTTSDTRSSSKEMSQGVGRPGSPSDAILIKRYAVPSLRVNTGYADLKREEPPQLNENYLSTPLDSFLLPSTHSKAHQRSHSAPTFWSVMDDSNSNPNMVHDHTAEGGSYLTPQSAGPSNSPFALFYQNNSLKQIASTSSLNDSKRGPTRKTSLGPNTEPTPPTSQHPDHPSPTGDNLLYPAPETPPAVEDPKSRKVECMFVKVCNTGSTLRKAISHIFGRNKLCTRQMPTDIWVHFCRKHYQRARYRNPKEYSKLQCDLVHQQIVRIHEWSKANAEARPQRPGIVQGWELTVRKREKNRLNDLSTPNRKRRIDALFEGDDNEEEDEDGVTAVTRTSHPITAVPQWLLDHCRAGYTTKEILEVFSRLHREILAGDISMFPDIEILPDLTTNSSIPKSPKGNTKRTSTATHRRTQSLGAAIKSTSSSPIAHSNQSSVWNEDDFGSPQQKRRRPSEREEAFDERAFNRSQYVERPVDTGRRITKIPHHPVFPDITENQREGYVGAIYSGSLSTYHNPLPAPIPQRSNGISMAENLENHNGHPSNVRRSPHGRSRSDISDFGHNQTEYAPPPSGFGMNTMPQTRQFQVHEQGRNSHGYSIPRQYPHQPYRDVSPTAGRWPEQHMSEHMPDQGHYCHQSTQQNSYAPPSTPYGREYQLPSHPPPQQRESNLPLIPCRIQETEEARNLCRARR